MKNIVLEGIGRIVEQEGGYCQSGIQIGDHCLDDVILEYFKKDFGPMRDSINIGHVKIVIEFVDDAKQ